MKGFISLKELTSPYICIHQFAYDMIYDTTDFVILNTASFSFSTLLSCIYSLHYDLIFSSISSYDTLSTRTTSSTDNLIISTLAYQIYHSYSYKKLPDFA